SFTEIYLEGGLGFGSAAGERTGPAGIRRAAPALTCCKTQDSRPCTSPGKHRRADPGGLYFPYLPLPTNVMSSPYGPPLAAVPLRRRQEQHGHQELHEAVKCIGPWCLEKSKSVPRPWPFRSGSVSSFLEVRAVSFNGAKQLASLKYS
ncbi:mCG6294, partial [Mus musculus]